MTRCTILAALLVGAICASTPVAAAPNDWTANGATACEKYLKPEIVATILRAPAGTPQRIDASSCHVGPIYITLKVASIDVFRAELPMIAGTHTMAGVGDGAYWNQAGAVSAVKGRDRGCDISVIDPRGSQDPRRGARTEARRGLQSTLCPALSNHTLHLR